MGRKPKDLSRVYPKRSITFHPTVWRLISAYRDIRGIGLATAVSELLLYFLAPRACPVSEAVVQRALEELAEHEATSIRDGIW